MDTIRKQIMVLLSEMEMTAIDLSRKLESAKRKLPPIFPMLPIQQRRTGARSSSSRPDVRHADMSFPNENALQNQENALHAKAHMYGNLNSK